MGKFAMKAMKAAKAAKAMKAPLRALGSESESEPVPFRTIKMDTRAVPHPAEKALKSMNAKLKQKPAAANTKHAMKAMKGQRAMKDMKGKSDNTDDSDDGDEETSERIICFSCRNPADPTHSTQGLV